MNKGLLISGLGHLGLVLWALLGGWFTWTAETPPVQVAQVSLISTSEFDAMISAAPKVDDTAPAPELQPPATKTPKPKPKPKPAEPAKPKPAPDPAPTPDAQTPEAPAPDAPVVPPVAPPSDTPQPIPVQPSDKAPAPSAAERIASTPVETTDQPKTADEATPAQSDTPSPDSQPVPDQPAASPEKTVTAVTPDAKPTEDNAPQLAPTSSPRPPARPKAIDTPPEETKTPDPQPADPAPDPAPADSSATDTVTPTPSQTGSGGTGDQPIGAALNSGEIDNLRRIIGPFWNIGSLSTDASRVTVTMRVELSQDQKILSVEMVDFTGGTADAAQKAFEAARRAVIRGASKGLGLPPDKYDTWKSMLFTFDTSQGRLR